MHPRIDIHVIISVITRYRKSSFQAKYNHESENRLMSEKHGVLAFVANH